MSEEVSKAVWPWVAPVLSVGLALAAFWLAWHYGWPWGAFLLAEGLALAALAVALWRTNEGYPWWAYPALFVGLVITFFSWLYLGGWLKLAEAIQAGSAVVLAFFTITLWRSTQAQAEATREMKALQQKLAESETLGLIALEWAKVNPSKLEVRLKVANASKYRILLVGMDIRFDKEKFHSIAIEGERFIAPGLAREAKVINMSAVSHELPISYDLCAEPLIRETTGSVAKHPYLREGSIVAIRYVYAGNPGSEQEGCFKVVKHDKANCTALFVPVECVSK